MLQKHAARLVFALVVCVALIIIGRNLYRKHLSQELIEALHKHDHAKTLTLLQRGVDPNAPSANKNASLSLYGAESVSPLYFAVEANDANTVNLLLAHGAKPDSIAFNLATSQNYHAIAMTLLQNGADPNARRSDLAWKTLDIDMPITDAAKHLDATLLQAMLDKGANPNVKNEFSQTALIIACNKGRRDVAEMLIRRGADPNIMGDGRTALTAHLSSGNNPYIALVRLLLDHKADVNLRKPDQFSALMLASTFGSVELIKLLLAAGADPRVRVKSTQQGNSGEWTALRLAQRAKRSDVVRLLQQAGATE